MEKLTMKAAKIIVLAGYFLSFVLPHNSAFAARQIMGYQIGQEVIRKKGVIVFKPNTEDEHIYNLLVNNQIHTIGDYAQWLGKNIHYKKDRNGDRWSRPMEVVKKRYGDCEDLALLNVSVLRVLGFKPKFLAFFNTKEGHAVCVFEQNKRYYYFDNKELREIREKDILEFAKNISMAKKYTEIKELDLETRKWNLIYKNS